MTAVPAVEAALSHITKNDSDILEEAARRLGGCTILSLPGGFLIHCYREPTPALVAEFVAVGLSASFVDLYRLAHCNGATWLELDCDADEYDELASYEW